MPSHPVVTALGLLTLLTACSGGSQPSTSTTPNPTAAAGGGGGAPTGYVRVENQSWANFNIFVVMESSRQRLGRSGNNSTAVFEIPSFYMAPGGKDLQFLLDPIGSNVNSISRRIRVSPGDTVHITIPPS